MKRIKNKLQQKIKTIKTVFIRLLCVSLKKNTTTTENNLCENEKIGKFEKIKRYVLKFLQMEENKVNETEEKNVIDMTLMTIALSGATGGAVIGTMIGGVVGGIIGGIGGTVISGYAEFESRRERRKRLRKEKETQK